MRSYLFIGGGKDGLRIPLADEPDTIRLPADATCSDRSRFRAQ